MYSLDCESMSDRELASIPASVGALMNVFYAKCVPRKSWIPKDPSPFMKQVWDETLLKCGATKMRAGASTS